MEKNKSIYIFDRKFSIGTSEFGILWIDFSLGPYPPAKGFDPEFFGRIIVRRDVPNGDLMLNLSFGGLHFGPVLNLAQRAINFLSPKEKKPDHSSFFNLMNRTQSRGVIARRPEGK